MLYRPSMLEKSAAVVASVRPVPTKQLRKYKYPLTRTHVKDPGMAWTSNNQLETHYITIGKEHTVCRIEENLLAGPPPPYSQALGKQITMFFFLWSNSAPLLVDLLLPTMPQPPVTHLDKLWNEMTPPQNQSKITTVSSKQGVPWFSVTQLPTTYPSHDFFLICTITQGASVSLALVVATTWPQSAA